MKIALLFPGQGSQTVGMGSQLAAAHPVARQTFDEADHALGYKLSNLCWYGPEDRLKLTEITQPAILTTSVAILRVLEERGTRAAFAAGHSLGEYSAHVAAGTMAFADAVRTVRNRGKYMQEAVPVGAGAMAAILALPLEEVERVCREAAQGSVCEPANINSPDQVVISGDHAAVVRAAELAKRRGARRAVLLPVSAPFHCSLMKPAQDRLRADLEVAEFRDLQVPLVNNWQAREVRTAAEAREGLYEQVPNPVRWVETIRHLAGQGITRAIEVGPGGVLGGLMRTIDSSIAALKFGEPADMEALGI